MIIFVKEQAISGFQNWGKTKSYQIWEIIGEYDILRVEDKNIPNWK